MEENTIALNQQLLTINQAKSYLKCSHVFLWKRRKEGKIKTLHAGKKVLLSKASIDAYLELEADVVNPAEKTFIEKEVANG